MGKGEGDREIYCKAECQLEKFVGFKSDLAKAISEVDLLTTYVRMYTTATHQFGKVRKKFQN